MKLKIKKQDDGFGVLTFVRDDGSGGFGTMHDLNHDGIETTLGLPQGFYCLLAQGWAIPGLAVKGAARGCPMRPSSPSASSASAAHGADFFAQ